MKRIRSTEKRIRHNCPSCQSTYTLLETHLTRSWKHPTHNMGSGKDNQNCPTNCRQVWEKIIHKYCQEKVLGQELEQEQENKENHGSN